MKPLSRKNVNRILSDIRRPGKKISRTGKAFSPRIGEDSRKPFLIRNGFPNFFKKASVGVLITVIILIVAVSFYLWVFKAEVTGATYIIYEDFKSAGRNLLNLDNDSVSNSLENVDLQVNNLSNKAGILSIIPAFKQIPEIFSTIKRLTTLLRDVNSNVADLKSKGLGIISGGGEFLGALKDLRRNIASINEISLELRNKLSDFEVLSANSDSGYIAVSTDMMRLGESLDSIVSILEKPGKTHFLVLFENPSEIRPAGGFVGSYADVIFENGVVQEIDVNDIYYPDKFLDIKVIPPKELHGMTRSWGARDANWFFNFPDSAKKIVEFLEASPVYAKEKVKFDGVAAVNVRIIEDILRFTGPVDLPDYKLTLDDTNFLREVQREIESMGSSRAGKDRKQILKAITPKLVHALSGLHDSEKRQLADNLIYRASNKDIKFYFKDEKLQNLVSAAGVAGEVFQIPASFSGDYLAVVDANVAGGKSDAFIKQKIQVVSRVDSGGVLNNNLVVTRVHNGQDEPEKWYKATNVNFIKVFALPDSKLMALTGNSQKIVNALADYKKGAYTADADLGLIEGTANVLKEFKAVSYEESGKTVFATWFNVAAGKTGELNLTYGSARKALLKPGANYVFVFDKQSGVESEFEYTVEAPSGFKWAESGDSIYHYKTTSLPARLMINLTLTSDGN
ncbi:MAG: DUF4012 domain-containing protein [Candidatus Colwellbacteria bacterium]|nr:DUF4012 domain-containing protein [Candidatus Colwellbacteria bacterium]